MIFQGDIYWIHLDDPVESEPAKRRPMVVVQNDVANQSAIRTTIMCALTTNLNLGNAPGNVLLGRDECSEANLPSQSVVNVSQIFTVNKSVLTDEEYIGRLSYARIEQILEGIQRFL